MQRMENPGTTRQIHGLLGLDAGSATPASILALRGIPADADDETLKRPRPERNRRRKFQHDFGACSTASAWAAAL